MNSNSIFQLRSVLQQAQSVLIVLAQNADDDTVAAGLALYLALVKMRKPVTIASTSDIRVAQAHLFAVDKITKKLAGGSNLVISFPYTEGSIEKVTSNIEGNTFNLVIEPRADKLNFREDQIQYSYGKSDFDTVFVLGARDLNALGSVYSDYVRLFNEKNIINIDKKNNNTRFGSINIVENAPISLIVTTLIRSLRIPLDQDPASNLYTGIMNSIGRVSFEDASPDLLEAVAFLMRSKAQLLKQSRSDDQKGQHSKQSSQKNAQSDSTPFNNDVSGVQLTQETEEIQNAPEDWLKPKIFTTQNNN